MIRSLLAPVVLLGACSAFSIAHASNRLVACEALATPFDSLAQLVWDSSVGNPPQTQLCHRTANAAKHFAKGRRDKAVDELHKFINETDKSAPRHIDETYAETLIGEAIRIIDLIDGKNDIQLGQLSGGIFSFGSNIPVQDAEVTVTFVENGQQFTAITDANGLFSIKELPPAGTFIVTAQDWSGASGSGQGTILPAELNASLSVFIDTLGSGSIQGSVSPSDMVLDGDVIVKAMFTDTGREYSTAVGIDGYYQLTGVHTDGTVIIIAFDNSSGATSSYSSVLSNSSPSQTINLQLQIPTTVNPELLNGGFENGIEGWTTEGQVSVVDRNIVFDIEE